MSLVDENGVNIEVIQDIIRRQNVMIDNLLCGLEYLKSYERVLGRKFKCEDCVFYEINVKDDILQWCKYHNVYSLIRNSVMKKCVRFKISSLTIAEIKGKDKEISKTKIDTHPRYSIQSTCNNMGEEISRLELIL